MNKNNSRAGTSGICRRLLSLMLAVCMVISMTTAAYAEDILQDTTPAEPAPEVTTPAEPAPEVTSPAEPAPEVTTPAEPTPEVTSPAEPAPEETTPAETTPTETDTTTEETDPAESPQVQLIRELISALPFEVTEDNADYVRERLQEILLLYSQLTPAEQELVDITPCYLLQIQLDDIDTVQTFGGIDEATATPVTASDTEWNGGYYKVTEDVTIPNDVTVNGDVTLILGESTTLTVGGSASGSIIVNSGNSITINGNGTLIVTGHDGAASIGGGYKNVGGKITINGGNINVTSTAGAAIGGGRDCEESPHGDITINGGNIIAESKYGGAGIGGATGQSCGNITINGGTVIAKSTYTTTTGAGIGGGSGANGGNIVINGGTVTAESYYGAGIGGGSLNNGSSNDGGTITITGGTVVASSDYGAAIGGGTKSYSTKEICNGGNITITGGNVTASGGKTNHYNSSIAPDIGGEGGSFSTGSDGHAIINASNISDTSNQADWSAIIFDGNSGTVYGNMTLNENFILESGKTLTVNKNSSLTIPAGITLTNNGTIEVYRTSQINGAISGNSITIKPSGTAENPIPVELSTTELKDDTYYVVETNVKILSRITVTGNVTLILNENCTLTAANGIAVNSGSSLTIEGNGSLNAQITDTATYSAHAAIGADSGSDAGTITINSGNITANAIDGSGIGGNGGTVNIYGGVVTARSENGAGIGNSNSNCKVYIKEKDNVKLIVYASSILFNSYSGNKSYWNGIVFDSDTSGMAYSKNELTFDLDIPVGATFTVINLNMTNATITIAEGSRLRVSSNGTVNIDENSRIINNGGTVLISEGCTINGNGNIEGSGTFITQNLTADMIPETFVYSGGDDQSTYIHDTIMNDTTVEICGQLFDFDSSELYWDINVTRVDNSNQYIVKRTYQDKNFEKTVTIAQSATDITASSDRAEYTYGETITVTANAAPTGEAPVMLASTFSLTEPVADQMAMFYGDTQVSEAVYADENGSYIMTVPVSALAEQNAPYDAPITLTAKFIGNYLMADAAAGLSVTLHKASLTITSAVIEDKVYDGGGIATVESFTFTDSNGDEVPLVINTDYTASARFTDVDGKVGNSKTVRAQVDEFINPNYKLEYNAIDTTGNITPRVLTSDDVRIRFKNVDNLNPSYTWAGEEIRPTIEVELSESGITIDPAEYTVSYSFNGEDGTISTSQYNKPRVEIRDAEGGNYTIQYTYANFTIICNHEFGFTNGECNVCSAGAAIEVAAEGEEPHYYFSTEEAPISSVDLKEILINADSESKNTGKLTTITVYSGWTVPEVVLNVTGKLKLAAGEYTEFALGGITFGYGAELTVDAPGLTVNSDQIKVEQNNAKITWNNGTANIITLTGTTSQITVNGGNITRIAAYKLGDIPSVTVNGGTISEVIAVSAETPVNITGGTIEMLEYKELIEATLPSAINSTRISGGSFGSITVNVGAVGQLLEQGYAFFDSENKEITLTDTTTTLANVFVEKAGAQITGELDLTSPEGESGSGTGYSWAFSDAGKKNFTLNLDNITVPGNIALPDDMDSITINLTGENKVGGFVSTRRPINAGDYQYADYKYNIVVTGAGTLTVGGIFCGPGSDNNRITIESGAAVITNSPVQYGASGGVNGILTVNGSLTVNGNSDTAVYGGKLNIGSTGRLTVSGKNGVCLAGTYSAAGRDYSGAFTMAEGAAFTANCTGANIKVFTVEKLTPEQAEAVFVIPSGYIPVGYKTFCVETGENQCMLTIAPDRLTDADIMNDIGMGGYIAIKLQPNYAAEIVDPDSYVYTGEPIIPKVNVTLDGVTVDPSKYTLIGENNTMPGEAARVTIKGVDPDLNITLTFTINCTHPNCDDAGICTVCNEQVPFAVRMRTSEPLKPYNDFAEAWAQVTSDNNSVLAYMYIYSNVDYAGTLTVPEESYIELTISDDVVLKCPTIAVEYCATLNLGKGTINGDIVLNEQTSDYRGGKLVLNGTINHITINDGAQVALSGGKILGGIEVIGGKKLNELIKYSLAGLKKTDGAWLTVEERNVAEITYPVDVVIKPFILYAADSSLDLSIAHNSKNVNSLSVYVSEGTPETVKWHKVVNGADSIIPEATAVEGFIPDVSELGTTQYYCVAESDGYTDISPTFTVTVITCEHEHIDENGSCADCGAALSAEVICFPDETDLGNPVEKYFATIEEAFAYAAEVPNDTVIIDVLKSVTAANTLVVPQGKIITLCGKIAPAIPEEGDQAEETAAVPTITGSGSTTIEVKGSLLVHDIIIENVNHTAILVSTDAAGDTVPCAFQMDEGAQTIIDGLDVTGAGEIAFFGGTVKHHITLPQGRELSELFAESTIYNYAFKVTNSDDFRWLLAEDLAANTVSGGEITIAKKPIDFEIPIWFAYNREYELGSSADTISISLKLQSESEVTINWYKITEDGEVKVTSEDGMVVDSAGLVFMPSTSVVGVNKYICRATCDGYSVATGEITVTVYKRVTVTATSALVGSEGTTVVNILILDGDNVSPEDGKFKQGDTVMAIIEGRLPSYRFLGWFDNETGEHLSDEFIYEFTAEKDINLVAKFESYGKASVTLECVNGAKIVYGDIVVEGAGIVSLTLPVGEMLILTAENPNMVSAWLNGSDKIIGKGEALYLTVTGDMTIKLVYNLSADSQTSMVQYVSDYGQLLSYQSYSASDTIAEPVAPSKLGYTFTKWSLTEDQIKAKITAGEKLITVTPVYEKNSYSFTVTVKYPTGTLADDTYSGAQGSGLTVTAKDIDGKVFTHWADESGNILSYEKSYFIQIASDVTLTANYADEAVSAQPVIAITSKYADVVDGKNKVSFVATRSVPENYTVVEHGVLYGIDSLLTADTMILGSAKVLKGQSSTISNNGVYTMNISVGNMTGTPVYARGYMIVRNNQTNNIETIYSAIESGSFDGLGGNK